MLHQAHPHLTHWLSWAGTTVAIHGAVVGDVLQQYVGVAVAIAFSVVSAIVYVHQLIFAGQLQREAARAEFRRKQELLDARNEIEIEKLKTLPPLS